MSCEVYVTSPVSAAKTGVYMYTTCNIDTVCAEPRGQNNLPAAYRDLVSIETGRLLVLIGSILTDLYPFREHLGPHTGEMLVKIGRKLTGEQSH
jgi:hypothetical protein